MSLTYHCRENTPIRFFCRDECVHTCVYTSMLLAWQAQTAGAGPRPGLLALGHSRRPWAAGKLKWAARGHSAGYLNGDTHPVRPLVLGIRNRHWIFFPSLFYIPKLLKEEYISIRAHVMGKKKLDLDVSSPTTPPRDRDPRTVEPLPRRRGAGTGEVSEAAWPGCRRERSGGAGG